MNYRNVDNAKVIKVEPRGANPKIWLDLEYKGRRREGLFKPTFVRKDGTNTQTHFGEAIYADVCHELLGFPCADIELATRDGQIGCISYNVLKNMNKAGNYIKDAFKLTDMVHVIGRIREPGIDVQEGRIKGTNEYYSLDLIREAIDEYIKDPKQNEEYKQYLLGLCLIDSSLNYFDRHAMNLAVAESRKTNENNIVDVYPPETFDNGTVLSLGIRAPELREYLDKGDVGLEELRDRAFSKIGISTEAPVSFPRLETMIFNHYFDEVEDLYKWIQSELSIDKVKEILDKYEDLEPIYKESILKQIEYNKRTMRERYEKAKKRNDIETVFNRDCSIEELNEILKSSFSKAPFSFNGNPINEEAYEDLKGLRAIPNEHTTSEGVTLNLATKNIAQWTVIIGSMMKAMDPALPEEAKKSLIKDYMRSEFDFCRKDLEQVEKIVDVYEMKLEEDTSISARNFIFGTKNTRGLGIENVKPFIEIKLAKARVSERHKERYSKFTQLYQDVLKKEEFINEYIPSEGKKARVFRQVGITEPDEMMQVMYSAIDKIEADQKSFESIDEFYEFLIQMSKETFKDKKVDVNGYLMDRNVKEFLDQNSYTLSDGNKITILTEQLKNGEFLSYLNGSSYFANIGKAVNVPGQSLIISARDENDLPQELVDVADKIAAQNALTENDIVKRIGMSKKKKKGKEEIKTGDVVALSTRANTVKGLDMTPDAIKQTILQNIRILEK